MADEEKSNNKKSILVIDDDITALDIVSFLFEDKGYSVERCAGGEQALAAIDQIKPEVVLVDLMMPGINGIDTVREIRSKGLDKTPILAFTATEDTDLHQQAIDAGCDKVLLKPLRSSRLLAEIESLLD